VAYIRVEHLKGASFEKAREGFSLTRKYETKLEQLAEDKRSSLLPTLVNYRHVKFYNIGPTIEVDIRNKHTSLLNYGKTFFFV